jgi:2-polyprenyl-6-methoxyphenol hydroxylase-like FAD-dependent oxidoreductase
MHSSVLIVGAGPTGLTLANILAKEGVSFRLIERDTGPIEQSRALWVHARTLELWDKLGVLSGALERGIKFNWVELLIDGKSKGKIPYEGKGISSHPYALVLEQNKTQAMLLAALAKYGKTPEWSTTLETFHDEGGQVTCQLKRADGSTETVNAKYLVAADGSTSVVRQQLGLTFEGETYDSSFFLADVKMETTLGSDRLYLNMTKKGFFAFFPLYHEDQSGKHYRLIGSLNPEQTAYFEKSKGVGAKASISSEDVEEHINNNSGLHVKILESRWASVYRIHRRMTNKYRVGKVFLAGDAAHIHSPAGGQGMNTGIGDGFNLGWKLAAVLKGQAQEKILESYEEERLPVAKDVLNKADKLFELETTQNPVLQQIKPLFMQTVSGILANVEAGRHWIFSFLSQIAVNYRNSSFVEEYPVISNHSGNVQAGDRLPYIELANGSNTHDFIRGFEHHMLVLGETTPAQQTQLQEICSGYNLKLETLPQEPSLSKKLSIKQSTIFLVRPDGYIAYRGAITGLNEFESYLQRLYLLSNAVKELQPAEGVYGSR